MGTITALSLLLTLLLRQLRGKPRQSKLSVLILTALGTAPYL
jgi:hypothetical protein